MFFSANFLASIAKTILKVIFVFIIFPYNLYFIAGSLLVSGILEAAMILFLCRSQKKEDDFYSSNSWTIYISFLISIFDIAIILFFSEVILLYAVLPIIVLHLLFAILSQQYHKNLSLIYKRAIFLVLSLMLVYGFGCIYIFALNMYTVDQEYLKRLSEDIFIRYKAKDVSVFSILETDFGGFPTIIVNNRKKLHNKIANIDVSKVINERGDGFLIVSGKLFWKFTKDDRSLLVHITTDIPREFYLFSLVSISAIFFSTFILRGRRENLTGANIKMENIQQEKEKDSLLSSLINEFSRVEKVFLKKIEILHLIHSKTEKGMKSASSGSASNSADTMEGGFISKALDTTKKIGRDFTNFLNDMQNNIEITECPKDRNLSEKYSFMGKTIADLKNTKNYSYLDTLNKVSASERVLMEFSSRLGKDFSNILQKLDKFSYMLRSGSFDTSFILQSSNKILLLFGDIKSRLTTVRNILQSIREFCYDMNILSFNTSVIALKSKDEVKGFNVLANAIKELSRKAEEYSGSIEVRITEVSDSITSSEKEIQSSVVGTEHLESINNKFVEITKSLSDIRSQTESFINDVLSLCDRVISFLRDYTETIGKLSLNPVPIKITDIPSGKEITDKIKSKIDLIKNEMEEMVDTLL